MVTSPYITSWLYRSSSWKLQDHLAWTALDPSSHQFWPNHLVREEIYPANASVSNLPLMGLTSSDFFWHLEFPVWHSPFDWNPEISPQLIRGKKHARKSEIVTYSQIYINSQQSKNKIRTLWTRVTVNHWWKNLCHPKKGDVLPRYTGLSQVPHEFRPAIVMLCAGGKQEAMLWIAFWEGAYIPWI